MKTNEKLSYQISIVSKNKSDIFLEMRGATGEFFIGTIISGLMITHDNDQPISLALMMMTMITLMTMTMKHHQPLLVSNVPLCTPF